jgi:response regulator RpfG family c-di-GMP phosphodiesterase
VSDHRILFVDDDANILQSYQRQLRKQFTVETANGAAAGLKLLEGGGPYAVVVSDMRMPDMNGVQFLAQVERIAPDAVRVMLTGNADQQTAIDAVNGGHIFRFLTKPCLPALLVQTLTASLEQYRLVIAERELLAKTFSGSVALLTEVLSLVKPQVFGRAARVKRLVVEVCQRLNIDGVWEMHVAAMLCQLGCITIPEAILEKVWTGKPLSPAETEVFRSHPAVAQRLIGRIPRLAGVAEMIARQFDRYEPPPADDDDARRRIRLGGGILKAVLDFDALVSGDNVPAAAVKELLARAGEYDPQVIRALTQSFEVAPEVRPVFIRELKEGMVLDEDIVTQSGNVLVARGQEVTEWMCERLRMSVGTTAGVREPIRVLCSGSPAAG